MYANKDYSKDPILKKISNAQDLLEKYARRVDALEKKLKYRNLPEETRDKMNKEINEIKELIMKEDHNLRYFYGENSKTFFFAMMVMFLSFLFYGLYLMIFGHNQAI